MGERRCSPSGASPTGALGDVLEVLMPRGIDDYCDYLAHLAVLQLSPAPGCVDRAAAVELWAKRSDTAAYMLDATNYCDLVKLCKALKTNIVIYSASFHWPLFDPRPLTWTCKGFETRYFQWPPAGCH